MRTIATIFAFLIALAPGLVQAQSTYTVTSTGDEATNQGAECTAGATDDDNCTLRAAIAQANQDEGSTIEFNIDEAEQENGAYRIRPQTELPAIAALGTVVDASTQPDWESDSRVIVLQGELCTSTPCRALRINGDDGEIRGFTIHSFAQLEDGSDNTTAAVRVLGDDNLIELNYIGIEFDGSPNVLGNRRGVRVTGDENIITNNVISNSVRHGISLRAIQDNGDVLDVATRNVVERNFIGTDPNGEGGELVDGLSPYGNGRAGVRIRGGAQQNVVIRNTIAYNGFGLDIDPGATGQWPGVLVRGNVSETGGVQTRRNQILRNRIFANDGLGIDLVIEDEIADRGSHSNQNLEGEQWPNDYQNYPEIIDAEYHPENDQVEVTYVVPQSDRTTDFYPLTIEFFMAEGSETGAAGMEFLGDDVWTQDDARTEQSVTFFAPDFDVTRDDFIVATATNEAGSTSEFSLQPEQLPVEFADVPSARHNEGAVILTWATLSETNNAGFQVQQRVDGSFENMEGAFVEGHGTTTSVQNYEYTLDGLAPGSHTLRLEQQDFDGTTDYSAEFSVTVPAQLELTEAAPNPFSDQTTVSLTVDEAQQITAEVYDVLGRRVTTLHDGQVSPDQPLELTFEANGLSSGLYLIRVEGETFSEVRRVTLVR